MTLTSLIRHVVNLYNTLFNKLTDRKSNQWNLSKTNQPALWATAGICTWTAIAVARESVGGLTGLPLLLWRRQYSAANYFTMPVLVRGQLLRYTTGTKVS